MKRYIEVTKRLAGRMITQRYPARSVEGTSLAEPRDTSFIETPCACGYICCAKTGPCAPALAPEPPAVVRVKARVRSVTRESLGGVLPKGWRMEAGAPGYLHTSGAEVHGDNGYFTWWTAGDAAAGITEIVHEPLPTRDEAMAAALASAQPDDEPYGCVNRIAESPRECVESGHYWCDAFKSKPQPAESTLRAGWRAIKRAFGGVYYFNGSLPDGCAVFDYAKAGMAPMWSCARDGEFYSTLEAAMQRAEALARGEP